jgi:hypothetical protein
LSKYLDIIDSNTIVLKGFDDAIVGVEYNYKKLVYDVNIMIEIVMANEPSHNTEEKEVTKINKTLSQLKKDAVGELKLAYAFEFQNLKKEHDKLLGNQGCGICIKGFFNAVRKDPNVDAKLEAIYGQKVNHDLAQLAFVTKTENVVEEISVSEWSTWYLEKMTIEDVTLLPKISSAVVIDDDVVVNYIKITKFNQDEQGA